MTILEELNTWKNLLFMLEALPNDLRSQNHTAYLAEVQMKIYDLEVPKLPSYPDTEADGIVFCGKCGKAK